MRVALFVTCLVDLVVPEVGVATARVLQRAGHEVVFPEGQTCCGQPAFNSGYRDEAARVLRAHAARAGGGAGADAYVAPAGSCTTMIRTFARAARAGGRRDLRRRAAAVRALGVPRRARRRRSPGGWTRRVAYHDSCHMLRELGLRREPRAALERLEGVELVDWDAERCCGFGGTFAVRQPELSVAMADEKLRTLDGADASVRRRPVVPDAPARAAARGSARPSRSRHLAELLEEGTR